MKQVRFGSVEEAFEAGVREGLFRHRLEQRGAEAAVDWEAVVEDVVRITFRRRRPAARKKARRGGR